MKSNVFIRFLLVFIGVSLFLCSVFFPVTRDEFYYLNQNFTIKSLLEEYYNSYNFINPRFGQLVCNFVARSSVVKPFFTLGVFFAYPVCLFTFVFRRLPNVKNLHDAKWLIIITAIFIFLIKTFGEFFLYIPYQTNYTFTHIFYIIYIFVLLEYYIYEKNIFRNRKIPAILLIFLGFVTGMGNEHVPPLLIAFSLLGVLYSYYHKRKIDFKIIIYQLSLIGGYLMLFFAPANNSRFIHAHKKDFSFVFSDYLKNFKMIIKLLYYYNIEIVIFLIICLVFLFLRKANLKFPKKEKIRIGICIMMGIGCIPIVSYSPLLGTRLLLFSFLLFIIASFIIFFKFINIKYVWSICGVYLILFFCTGIFVTKNAHNNQKKVMNRIAENADKSKIIKIDESFDYFTKAFPFANRWFLLDSGKEYIDCDSKKNTSMEMNLKNYYNLKEISLKDCEESE